VIPDSAAIDSSERQRVLQTHYMAVAAAAAASRPGRLSRNSSKE